MGIKIGLRVDCEPTSSTMCNMRRSRGAGCKEDRSQAVGVWFWLVDGLLGQKGESSIDCDDVLELAGCVQAMANRWIGQQAKASLGSSRSVVKGRQGWRWFAMLEGEMEEEKEVMRVAMERQVQLLG